MLVSPSLGRLRSSGEADLARQILEQRFLGCRAENWEMLLEDVRDRRAAELEDWELRAGRWLAMSARAGLSSEDAAVS